jgi:L,D-peptidoglycan transpeptidase YkuD (ErfK/YbiS/YcfS/YnhG family)
MVWFVVRHNARNARDRGGAVPAAALQRAVAVAVAAVAAAAVLLAVAPAGAVTPLVAAPAAAATPAWHPSRLTHLGDSRQVVVVTAGSATTTWATLRTFRRDARGRWHEQFAPMRARLGSRGFAAPGHRRQRSGETPSGTYLLPRAFGSAADPGTALPYRRFDRTDWWPYDPRDPRTYNVYQFQRVAAATWRRSWAEHLWDFRGQYAYSVVIDYNLPSGVHPAGRERLATRPADTGAGGGIFLHVSAPHPTAGCVSVSRAGLRAIVRWLAPSAHPRIVMAALSDIGRV